LTSLHFHAGDILRVLIIGKVNFVSVKRGIDLTEWFLAYN